MADYPAWAGPQLTSDQQALDVGYDEGRALRANGGDPTQLDELREIHFERPYPDDRGLRNLFHAAWQFGFDAGFMGEDKPLI
jgi:hypothetical protein